MKLEQNFKDFEEKIYDYLNNPGKYDHVSFYDNTYIDNRDTIFPTLLDEKNPSSPSECASYLLGKAMEMRILQKTRPSIQRIWVSPDEVTSNIVFNLPKHLEDAVIEAMDGCENAVDKYIAEKNPDVKTLLTDIQYIGEKICNDYEIYNLTVGGYKNSEIAYPSEMYVFSNNVILKQFVDEGYKINGITNNFNAPVSCVLTSPKGEKMVVLECVTVSPKTANFQAYLKNQLKREADKEKANPYLLGIMLEPEEEDLKDKGIALKNGKTSLRRTDFLPL